MMRSVPGILVSAIFMSFCLWTIPAKVVAQDFPARIADLRLGMTADEVFRRLNHQKPEQVSRQLIYRRHLEQWYYENGSIRLDFDCRPAEEPRLVKIIQTAIQPKP